MKRSGPLARRTPLRRSGPLRQRSSKPSAKARRAAAFGVQAELCRTLPCSCGCGRGPCDPHHEPPRSRGGKDEHTLPLYRECHDARHSTTAAAFWRDRGRDPDSILAELRAQVTQLAPVTGRA